MRPQIPAVVHIDGTARPQIVRAETPRVYEAILRAFGELTGVKVLVNTSMNAHEEPICATLHDSLSTLLTDSMDVLVVASGIFYRPGAGPTREDNL